MLKFLTKAIIFLGLVLGAITFVYLYDLYQEIKDDIDSVVNYNPKQSTQFFDKNGKLLANTFKDENREYVNYDDIPARVIEGLVAIEDTQFFEHFGVNKEENTIDDDLHCPKCKSTNVSCACFGENDGCNCRDCNHSFMIHD